MTTNLSRLHDVVLGKERSRGSGKTFARCHELAGIVEVGHLKDIVIRISFYQDIDYLLPMIHQVFDEHNLEINNFRYKHQFISNGKRIIFIPDNCEFKQKTRGIEYDLVVMTHSS